MRLSMLFHMLIYIYMYIYIYIYIHACIHVGMLYLNVIWNIDMFIVFVDKHIYMMHMVMCTYDTRMQ